MADARTELEERVRGSRAALLPRSTRAQDGSEQITAWCPTCKENAVPMRNGTCGFCDTPIAEPQPSTGAPADLAEIGRAAPSVPAVVPAGSGLRVSRPRGRPSTRTAPKIIVACQWCDWRWEGTVAERIEKHDCPNKPVDGAAPTFAKETQTLQTGADLERAGDREGWRARDPILSRSAAPTDEERRIADEMNHPHDPRRSPILDYLTEHGQATATEIADTIGRKTANVSTRLRQMEHGGFVRRAGHSVNAPGGRGGPRIVWELADPDKPPTDPTTSLDVPPSQERVEALRARYTETLLELVKDSGTPEHVFDRLERLLELDR